MTVGLRVEVADAAVRVATDCPHFARSLATIFDRETRADDEAVGGWDVGIWRHQDESPERRDLVAQVRSRGSEVVVNETSSQARFRAPGRELVAEDGRQLVWLERSRTLVVTDDRGGARRVDAYSPCRPLDDVIETYASDDGFRVVRNAVYLALIDAGFVWLHAAAATVDGRTFLIVGDNHSGKTLTLLTFLARGGTFHANSRSFLRASDGGVDLVTCPERIMLRRAHLATIAPLRRELLPDARPEDETDWRGPGETKLAIFYRDLARILGCATAPRARVDAILFPRLWEGPRAEPPALGPDERREILRRNVQNRSAYDECGWYLPPAARTGRWAIDAVLGPLASLGHAVAWLDAEGELQVADLD